MTEPKVFLAIPKIITFLEADQKGLPSAEECPIISVFSFYAAKREADEPAEDLGKALVPEFAQLYASSIEELESVLIDMIKASCAELKDKINK